MKTKLLLILFSSLVNTSYSQIGGRTQTPLTFLHLEPSSSSAPSGEDGIIVPRVQNFPETNPERLSQLLFLDGNSEKADDFYYWDGEKWFAFPGSIERLIDETVYSFEGQGYTGVELTRAVNFTKFKKKTLDGFSLAGNEITVGKNGLYLINFTGNVKRPTNNTGIQSNFTYSIFVNDVEVEVVQTSISGEITTSTGATLNFLQRLETGDKLRVEITKTNEGLNNYVSFGSNNLMLSFIID